MTKIDRRKKDSFVQTPGSLWKKRFNCYNTCQLTASGNKKQETSNKCIVAIEIKIRYIDWDT